MSYIFSLYTSNNNTLKGTTFGVNDSGIVTDSSSTIASALGLSTNIVPSSVSTTTSGTTTTYTFKDHSNNTLLSYSYDSSSGSQTINVTNTNYSIMESSFILNYTIHSSYLYSQSPLLVDILDLGPPPIISVSEILTLDSVIGKGGLQFKVKVSGSLGISNTSITDIGTTKKHYSMTLSQNSSSIPLAYTVNNTSTDNAFYNLTSSQVNSTSIQSVKADIVYLSSTRSLAILLNDGGQITLQSTTSGDPHIFPVYGKMYELPMRATAYRLLQGKDVVLNASTRFLTSRENEEIRNYYEKVVKTPPPESLISNGVVYDKVYLHSEGHDLEYDFNSTSGSLNDSYFSITQKILKHDKLSKYECSETIQQIVVSFTHSVYGYTEILLNHFSNPQMKYGVGVNTCTPQRLSGLLIREYKCKTMTVRRLKNKKYKKGVVGRNPTLSYFK